MEVLLLKTNNQILKKSRQLSLNQNEIYAHIYELVPMQLSEIEKSKLFNAKNNESSAVRLQS